MDLLIYSFYFVPHKIFEYMSIFWILTTNNHYKHIEMELLLHIPLRTNNVTIVNLIQIRVV